MLNVRLFSWKEIDVQFSKSLFFIYWLYLSYLPWYNHHSWLGFETQLSLPLSQSAVSRKLHQWYIFLQGKVTRVSCWTIPWKLKPYFAKWLGPHGLLFCPDGAKKNKSSWKNTLSQADICPKSFVRKGFYCYCGFVFAQGLVVCMCNVHVTCICCDLECSNSTFAQLGVLHTLLYTSLCSCHWVTDTTDSIQLDQPNM